MGICIVVPLFAPSGRGREEKKSIIIGLSPLKMGKVFGSDNVISLGCRRDCQRQRGISLNYTVKEQLHFKCDLQPYSLVFKKQHYIGLSPLWRYLWQLNLNLSRELWVS